MLGNPTNTIWEINFLHYSTYILLKYYIEIIRYINIINIHMSISYIRNSLNISILLNNYIVVFFKIFVSLMANKSRLMDHKRKFLN